VKYEIDISSLLNGMYLVKITGAKRVVVDRLVIKKP